MAKSKKSDYTSTTDLSLEEFLEVIKLPHANKLYYPIARFPTDAPFCVGSSGLLESLLVRERR
jgi:hypothetical protein